MVCPADVEVMEIPTIPQPEPVPVEVVCVLRSLMVFPFTVRIPTEALIPFVTPVEVQLLIMFATVLLLIVAVVAPEVTAIPVSETAEAPVEV